MKRSVYLLAVLPVIRDHIVRNTIKELNLSQSVKQTIISFTFFIPLYIFIIKFFHLRKAFATKRYIVSMGVQVVLRQLITMTRQSLWLRGDNTDVCSFVYYIYYRVTHSCFDIKSTQAVYSFTMSLIF